MARSQHDLGTLALRGKLRGLLPALGEPHRIAAQGPAAGLRARANGGYIVSPRYDGFFFIGAPLLALILGLAIGLSAFSDTTIAAGSDRTWVQTFLGTFIFAHLFAVVFRSHLNRDVFHTFPWRFTLAPIALFVAIGLSSWVLVIASVVATFWDVYHSSMQTFGLGRIYDMRAGNDFRIGRRLDIGFNLFLYAGPIAAGATLMDHIEDFGEFEAVGGLFFTQIPAHVESNAGYLSIAVIATGLPFFAWYLFSYWRLANRGYRISKQKVVLFAATGMASIWAWGFNPFGEAFFIMNVFHALQYFAIVWWSEKMTMMKAFRLTGGRWAALAALTAFLAISFGYGLWAEALDSDNRWLLAGVLVVALMHFWYDGFIWSVSRASVKVR